MVSRLIAPIPASQRSRRLAGPGAVGLLVFAIALAGLAFAPRHDGLALAGRTAIRDVLRDPAAQQTLRGLGWTRATASRVDDRLVRVDLFAGSRVVAEFACDPAGRLVAQESFQHRPVPYGNWIAYRPAVLIALAGIFLLMVGVTPLWHVRNLEAAASLSLIAPVVLLQERYIAACVLTAIPGLGYLMARALRIGWGGAPAESPARSLFTLITSRLRPREQARVLTWIALALGAVFLMVAISSTEPVDVVYAVMEGATKLLHGVLPYGHLPGDVMHGDTYPILSYVAYVPLAIAGPVRSTWDSVDIALGFTALAALASSGLVGALARVRVAAGTPGGMSGRRAAVAWLSFPPLLIASSSGTSDVLLAVMLLLALLLLAKPRASIAVLALAGWFKLAPFALLPIWLAPLRGRRLRAALITVAAISVFALLPVVLLGGAGGIQAMLTGISYQLTRASPQSVWSALHLNALQPVGEAAMLGLLGSIAVRIRHRPEIAADPARMAALAAAVLIGIQLAGSYWSLLYSIWVIPLFVVSRSMQAEAPERVAAPIWPAAAQPSVAG